MLKKLKIINKGGYTRQYLIPFKFIAYTSCVLGVDETATLYEFGYIDENQTTNPIKFNESTFKLFSNYIMNFTQVYSKTHNFIGEKLINTVDGSTTDTILKDEEVNYDFSNVTVYWEYTYGDTEYITTNYAYIIHIIRELFASGTLSGEIV